MNSCDFWMNLCKWNVHFPTLNSQKAFVCCRCWSIWDCTKERFILLWAPRGPGAWSRRKTRSCLNFLCSCSLWNTTSKTVCKGPGDSHSNTHSHHKYLLNVLHSFIYSLYLFYPHTLALMVSWWSFILASFGHEKTRNDSLVIRLWIKLFKMVLK